MSTMVYKRYNLVVVFSSIKYYYSNTTLILHAVIQEENKGECNMSLKQTTLQEAPIFLPPGISLRKDGRYQARFTYNGKRYTLYDRNLNTLIKRFYEAKYEIEHGIYKVSSHFTLNQWFQIWIKEYKALTVKNYTLTSYINNYDRYIKIPLGNCSLKQIHTLQIQRLFNSLISGGLSTGTVQYLHTLLKGVFGQAVKNNMLLSNPSLAVVLPKTTKKPIRVLSVVEQSIFLEAIKDNYYRILYMLALSTGLRVGELTGLMWDDIDFDKETLTVNRTLLYFKSSDSEKYSFHFQTPKSTTSNRIVPLIPQMVAELKLHKKQQQLLPQSNEMKNLVFTTRVGTPLQEVYLFKDLAAVVNKINTAFPEQNFDTITPHTLRHTFATRAFENGLAAKTVQELLGHSNIHITMDLYTHVTNDIKVREMKKLSNILQLH